jgi:hypothetical protein
VFVAVILDVLCDTGFGRGRILGARQIVGAVFGVAGLVVCMLVVCRCARGCLRRCSLCACGSGFGFDDRLCLFAWMAFAAFAVCVRVFTMIVRIMIVLVQWLVMAEVVVMVGFGVVRLSIARLMVALEGVDCLLVGVFHLACDLRLEAGVFDDLALDALAITPPTRAAVARTAPIGAIFIFFLGFAMSALVGFDQCLTIGDRDLIIVRMNFAEGKKAVAVAAVFDKGRLKRRLHARDLGEVDVATKLFALSSLEIKLFDAIAADHNNPGLLRVGGIDKHFVGHFVTLGGGGRV